MIYLEHKRCLPLQLMPGRVVDVVPAPCAMLGRDAKQQHRGADRRNETVA
jgi:hypothetical protein